MNAVTSGWAAGWPDVAESPPESDREDVSAVWARVEAIHRRSARRMRANGHARGAAAAERYAAWTRIAREQPETTWNVYRMVGQLRAAPSLRGVVDAALDDAMSLFHADFGNVQLLDRRTGGLRIVSHSGFSDEFLDYFSAVDDTSSACGRAAKDCAQVVITDVNDDVAFRPHRFIAAASRFRAVQSTPLVDRRGQLQGMVSTHFRQPHRPPDRELVVMAHFGELIAEVVRARLEPQHDTHAEASSNKPR